MELAVPRCSRRAIPAVQWRQFRGDSRPAKGNLSVITGLSFRHNGRHCSLNRRYNGRRVPSEAPPVGEARGKRWTDKKGLSRRFDPLFDKIRFLFSFNKSQQPNAPSKSIVENCVYLYILYTYTQIYTYTMCVFASLHECVPPRESIIVHFGSRTEISI